MTKRKPFPSREEFESALAAYDFDKLRKWVRLTATTDEEQDLYLLIQEMWQER